MLSPAELREHVKDVTYEVRWLTRGQLAWDELDGDTTGCGSFWRSDLGNLGLEAALIHCRALLEFLEPRSSARDRDARAGNYVPGWKVPDRRARAALGRSVEELRDELDGRLAHIGATRLVGPSTADWRRAFVGTRELIVDFCDQLGPSWEGPFAEVRDLAQSAGPRS